MTKKDSVVDAPSQAQSTSAEPEQQVNAKPEEAVEAGSADATGADSEIQFFDGSVVKFDKDGNEVISDHLAAGEKLRRPSAARYTRSTANAKAEYEAGK